jgi:hypothetical protein
MSRTSPLLRTFSLILAGTLAGTVLLVPGGSQAAGTDTGKQPMAASTKTILKSEFGKATSNVTGTFGSHGVFTGAFTPKKFRTTSDGALEAVGRLEGKLVRGSGSVVGKVAQRVAVPVATIEGTSVVPDARAAARAVGDCDILNLVLGPLDLDLLGLQVHLDRVVLNIIAASGTGNLLGNLLCAVAGLLDGTGALTQIGQILNSILAILKL